MIHCIVSPTMALEIAVCVEHQVVQIIGKSSLARDGRVGRGGPYASLKFYLMLRLMLSCGPSRVLHILSATGQ